MHSRFRGLGARIILAAVAVALLAAGQCRKPDPRPRAVNELAASCVTADPRFNRRPIPGPQKLQPLSIPGTTPNASCPERSIRTIELRGWIRGLSESCNLADPDWHYDLEVDAAWAEQAGLDLNKLHRVGNILEHGVDRFDTGSWRRVAATPLVHIELWGWDPMHGPEHEPSCQLPPISLDQAPPRSETAPAGWISGLGEGDCQRVSWPFDPTHPVAGNPRLAVGQYVRVVGSLVMDEGHYTSACPEDWGSNWLCRVNPAACSDRPERNATYEIWSGGRDRWDLSNPASWTEIHPPDIIDVPNGIHVKSERLVGVAVVANHCLIAPCASETLDLEIPVPEEGRQLFPDGAVVVTERVGTDPGETNLATIEEGNSDRTGARIEVLDDRVRIHVKVRGRPQLGAPGKFKAIYRVGWKAKLP